LIQQKRPRATFAEKIEGYLLALLKSQLNILIEKICAAEGIRRRDPTASWMAANVCSIAALTTGRVITFSSPPPYLVLPINSYSVVKMGHLFLPMGDIADLPELGKKN